MSTKEEYCNGEMVGSAQRKRVYQKALNQFELLPFQTWVKFYQDYPVLWMDVEVKKSFQGGGSTDCWE